MKESERKWYLHDDESFHRGPNEEIENEEIDEN